MNWSMRKKEQDALGSAMHAQCKAKMIASSPSSSLGHVPAEHTRYHERMRTAQEIRGALQIRAQSQKELNEKSAFGYTGTATSPLLSHRSPTYGSVESQHPEVHAQFSGEYAVSGAEELRPYPARRRRCGPKKPVMSKKVWKCANTPAVIAGEKRMKEVVSRTKKRDQAELQQKMARQMYERNQCRFSVSESAFNREVLETRSGQRHDLLVALQASLEKPSTGPSSRKEVAPGDVLQSIERFSRNAGSLAHEKRCIFPNGTASRSMHNDLVLPHFVVDESQRERRRVVTGGTADRLNYSDGSLAVLLPPRVIGKSEFPRANLICERYQCITMW